MRHTSVPQKTHPQPQPAGFIGLKSLCSLFLSIRSGAHLLPRMIHSSKRFGSCFTESGAASIEPSLRSKETA